MSLSGRRCLSLVLLAFAWISSPAAAQYVPIGSGFVAPCGVAVDPSGNLFVVDEDINAVFEVLAAGDYVDVNAFGVGKFVGPCGVAVDRDGNVFVADTGTDSIKEMMAAGGYTTVKVLATGFSTPLGLALDSAGNVFVADHYNGVVKELSAASGYAEVTTIVSGLVEPQGVAVDRAGNLFVTDLSNSGTVWEVIAVDGSIPASPVSIMISDLLPPPAFGFDPFGIAVDPVGDVFVTNEVDGAIYEIIRRDGSASVITFRPGVVDPAGVAVDGHGNVFIAGLGSGTVEEIQAGASPMVASVLPGSRSIQVGTPATVFATMINAGAEPLANCQIALPLMAPPGLTLSYQATDAVSNSPIGTPNAPVQIPGNDGSQSFVVTFQGTMPFSAPAMPLDFACDLTAPAAIIPGVDTIDLALSTSPTPDVIALSATPTNNGVIDVPQGGVAAFAIASINVGATGQIIVSADTGDADLPATMTICQTDPATGACLSPPAASVPLTYAGGTTPTFSVFLQATGPIAFAPGASRVFVRFEDAGGGFHGSTSVAIETS